MKNYAYEEFQMYKTYYKFLSSKQLNNPNIMFLNI